MSLTYGGQREHMTLFGCSVAGHGFVGAQKEFVERMGFLFFSPLVGGKVVRLIEARVRFMITVDFRFVLFGVWRTQSYSFKLL